MMHPAPPKTPHHRQNHSNPHLVRSPSPQAPPRPPNCKPNRPEQRTNGLLETRPHRSPHYAYREKSPIKANPDPSLFENPAQDYVSKLMQKARSVDRLKMSQARVSRDHSAAKPTWRKHESIQQLLEKENRQLSTEKPVKTLGESTAYDQCMVEMEQKYKELQIKYKKLMSEATTQAREYEQDRKELEELRTKTKEGTTMLSQLKTQLLAMNQATKKGRYEEQLKSQEFIETDISTIHSVVTPTNPHHIWKKQEEEERKIRSELNIPKPNQTSTSWYPKDRMEHSSTCISQQQASRYYSASKASKVTTTNTLQSTKSVKNLLAASRASKAAQRTEASLKASKMRCDTKVLDTTLKRETEGARGGPSTLQKKKLGSSNAAGRGYDKYRFEPTFRMA